jgi:predicted acetyltransferase
MIVRNPTKLEVPRATEVASIAFPNLSLEHWTKSFDMVAEVFGTRYILIVEDEGQIVSTLLCQPMPVYINGSPVSHSSTGAVATIPEARNKGCAGAMMAETVRLLRSEKVYLSSLWPFSYEYYRKYGWEIASETRSYSGPGKVFMELGDASKAREAVEGDLRHVKAINDDWAQNYNCLTQRSDAWWDRVLDVKEPLKTDTHAMVLHMTDGRLDAYAAYKIGGDDENRAIDVNEIAFLEAEHRRDMLALLGSMVPEGKLSFIAPMDDLFLQEMPNPRLVNTGVNASFQFRVIDPKGAMESLSLDEDISGRISFSLTDPVFKEGWEFGVEADGGEVSIIKPNPRCRLEMSVETFARLYSGYLTPYDAWELGRIKANGAAMEMLVTASEMFSPLTPYRTWMEPG